jgi:hypothetical protein
MASVASPAAVEERPGPGGSTRSAPSASSSSRPNMPSHTPPPEGGDDPFLHRTIGAGGPGVVLADTADDGLHVWFAPLTPPVTGHVTSAGHADRDDGRSRTADCVAGGGGQRQG